MLVLYACVVGKLKQVKTASVSGVEQFELVFFTNR